MINKKGYLGPLGDDFPALFPIAMGLMLFFGSINITYSNYTLKKDTATLMRANLALSKAIRAQNVFTKDYFFGENLDGGVCVLLLKTKSNYGVQAKIEVVTLEGRDFEPVLVEFEGRRAECGDLEDEDGNKIPGEREFFVAMNYPVVLQVHHLNDPTETLPVTLVITTWRA